MHRNILLEMLERYNPIDQKEQNFKKQIVEFVQKHPECFERSLEVGHITGSAWLLNKERTHVLLMHHAKLNMWLQLGGHCDGNADVLAVAVKEAQEESGIMGIEPVLHTIFDVDVHPIPANSREKAHYHYDIRFLLHVTSDEQLSQNSESKELRWIDKNHANLPTHSESIVRMFDKWIKI